MKVLCVCGNGESRSRLLAEYLAKLGYEAKFCGVRESAKIKLSKELIDWADVIIFLRFKFLRLALEKFWIKKPLIALEVHDIPASTGEKLRKLGMFNELRELQEKLVLHQIKMQIGHYLPLEEFVKNWYEE